MNLKSLEQAFSARQPELLADWAAFLRFPSISADPAHQQDCVDCAGWLADRLRRHGFVVELASTRTKPFVFAERRGKASSPTVLIYGHYDVQPVDPLGAWTSPPFAPAWRGDRLYARGAQDNKGQVFYTLAAIEALIAANALDVNLKVLIEGEEEYSSTGLAESLDAWKDRLQADILMVHDTCTVQSGAPTIIMGLRGIVDISARLIGADHDLHSGVHGGLAPNAAQGMAQLVASLFDPSGRVVVPGFYDGVALATDRDMELASTVPFDPNAYQQQTGTSAEGGMRDLPPCVRVGFLPSLDINGLHAGYGGSGMKTIIPSEAILKLTARLVPDQNPAAVLEGLSAHLVQHTPPGMRLVLEERRVGGPGFRLDSTSAHVKKAQAVLSEIDPEHPVAFLWEGASIPIVARLARTSNAAPLLVGFGNEADRIHAPDESFSLAQFKAGFLYVGLMLQQLS